MSSLPPDGTSLAFIGGTGPEGRGLALRFAGLGHRVFIGSRSAERARNVAEEMASSLSGADIRGMANREAAETADVVILTIPYSGVTQTLPELVEVTRGKIVVSAIAPIEFQEGRPIALRLEAGSAAQEVQAILSEALVVSAFQTIDSHRLGDPDTELDTDVIVCSDNQEARRAVVTLAGQLPGVRALSGGRLAASRYVEEVTALLITLNRIYKVHSGIRITGVRRE